MISEAPYIKFKEKQIYFILREVTSHIVGYPTGPILQARGKCPNFNRINHQPAIAKQQS